MTEGGPIEGLMQQWPLTLDRLISHARRWHPKREIVSRAESGDVVRTTYCELHDQSRRVSAALLAASIRRGDRIATLAMNGGDHLAVWYGIMGIGAICHTLNPRLLKQQLSYMVNHASDRMIFADGAFAPLLDGLLGTCPSVETVIFLSPPIGAAELPVPTLSLSEFCQAGGGDCSWGGFDENSAAGLCYTSGTTGNPKGALYSHRSNFLHTLFSLQADMFGLGERDVVLPVVPMYHANAWGFTFSAPAVGAKLVLPGQRVDAESLLQLIEREDVTIAAGVPTVWLPLLRLVQERGMRLPSLRRLIVGGAACPERVITGFEAIGVEVVHAWGMTEMSPLGGVASPTSAVAALKSDEQLRYRLKQGRTSWGVDLRLVGEGGEELPFDGRSMGSLRVRGPAVASAYFGEDTGVLDSDGWFDTGDIATIDQHGYMQITDRAKDIIKSGGEWISSIEVENAALLHEAAAFAGVIGVADARWGERPILFVTLKPALSVTEEEFKAFLAGKVARWWIPDRVLFLDTMPLGATGKVDKKVLRARIES
jgi:fatty-acyl-CoA synthase